MVESDNGSKSNLSQGAQKILEQLHSDQNAGNGRQTDSKQHIAQDSQISGLSSQFGKGASAHEEDEGDSNVDNSDEDIKAEDVIIKSSDLIYQPESQLREWLRKHGKQDYIDF